MPDLSYVEKQDKLAIRIRAHKEFANFDIDHWIEEYVAGARRRRILDLGCGSGNHIRLYLRHVPADGLVAGLDREPALIEEARNRFPVANVDLRVGSMDERLPYPDASFDLCFSNFAIYNSRDPEATLREVRRVLEPGEQVVLIGPTLRNAEELYSFNERLTGEAIDPITLVRTDRMRQEVEPAARRVFDRVEEVVINSRLTFPDREEFVRYYMATMLYEETGERRGVTYEQMLAACPLDRDIPLSKEMLAVIATKDSTAPDR